MTTRLPFAYAETPGGQNPERRPWLEDRHHPLLGRHLPRNVIPDYPDYVIRPGYQKDKVLPVHFTIYSRVGQNVITDAAPTWEEAKYRLRLFVESRNE